MRQWHPMLIGLLSALMIGTVVCGAFITSPWVNHYAKRLAGIPVELSGPHVYDPGHPLIAGSKDFAYCALSSVSGQDNAICEIKRTSEGWTLLTSGTNPRPTCAALCLK